MSPAVVVFAFTLSAHELLYAGNLLVDRVVSGFTMGAVKG